ncbi:rRNA maturation RNase YbeY [Candidatus Kaiserbacteria bacterium RIFOXYB1_FULL_46_14]|uniref:Endoribonuclease YbeY n=1 Tax=Candidatus Kaiserbacteria bacterium RIFOXYB1_FULL_46_14 TaxID=1798531 RepID=A0A1F6FIM0_9BACT|nr:MAG: rRNA maturation RNase YbeY [Candidatus Kaiserbacteria bacterium RIFOXYB1_FULL_46_14]
MSITIDSTVRKAPPSLPYEMLKDEVLGKRYSLYINFVGEKRGRNINQESRGKSYVPNVLSFPLTESSGEIYITPAVAKREAKDWDHTYPEHVQYLFIHGLLHLKGYDHGDKMEALESKLMKKCSIKRTNPQRG